MEGPSINMDQICELFGKSKQAYYQHSKYEYKEEVKTEILIQMVNNERKTKPRLGGRKLLIRLQPHLSGELTIGRDAFFDLLRREGLLVRRRRNRTKTTNSYHRFHKYPNLIKDFTPDGPHQLWVSDITYIETSEGFGYLSLITDAYSRKIIGWELGPTLESKYTIKALQMALYQLPKEKKEVIHHSDRGVQYCCDEYVKLLNKNCLRISMTENGDPLENAIAERVNGILKDEWLYQMKLKSIEDAKKQLTWIIRVYNKERPHSSCDMNTPEKAHYQNGELKKHWKNYYQLRNNIQQSDQNGTFDEPNKAMAIL